MDGMNEQERAIAWLWAIEALASFREVNVSLLHDLIEMAPALPDDMGKNAKERVALRCLEGLLGPCDVMSGDVPSAQHSKCSFDLSESCENVLKRVVDETPESDLRVGGPGLLKWDIRPFIIHKRASLPKCALKQLKDSIIDGTHPHADFLRVKSGLTRSYGDRVPVVGSNTRLNESCSSAQNMGVKGNSDPLIHQNENKPSEEDPDNANLLPSKGDRIASDAENMEDENRSSINDSDDWHIKSKKMKQDGSYVLRSTEQNQLPLHGKELLEDSSERERCNLAGNHMGMMEEGTVLEDGHDDTASKRSGQSSSDAIHKSQSKNHLNATSMPEETLWDEAHQDSCVGQAEDDGGLHPEPRTLSVAPPDGTQLNFSAKVFNCKCEHDFHIKAPHPASADRSQEKSIAEDGKGLAGENLADENRNRVIHSDDCYVMAKRMKWDASYVLQSIEQNQIPLHGRELLEDSSERDVPLSGRERRDLAENQIGMMDGGKVIDDDHDYHTASKRCGQSTDNAVHKSQSENPCNETSMTQGTFQDGAPQYTYVDEAKDDGGLHPELRASCVAVPDETQHKVSTKVFNCNSEQDFHIEVPHPASADEPRQKSIAYEDKDDREQCPETRISGTAPLGETQHKDSAKESDSNSEHDSCIEIACPASADGSQQKSIPDEAKELLDWLRHYESETLTNNDGFHDEKIDVAMKKHAFLSSQCTSSHRSSVTADWTERNLGKESNESGQLLICKTSDCPVVVHENWLRSSAIHYEKGNFYCPFCIYSLDLTEYLEAKKETSLLKKDLDAFIHTLEHQPKECLGRPHNKENFCTRNFDEDLNEKSHQNGHLGEREKNLGKQCEEHANEVNDFQFQNITGNEKHVAPFASCVHVNSECGDESATAVCRKLDVSTGEKEEEEKVARECIPVGVPLSSKNTENLLTDQGYEVNIDSEQVDNQKSSTSKYSIRPRRSKNLYSYPATRQLRRIKVPWTVEEEEMLKKGVETISRTDEGNIPWKQILEFGGSVFLHSRTPIDLKDKWRNICRRRSKSK
ncbi:uncharacterized protein Pyn_31485 [Prunus yedoensis var. nudiflora]|uniref:Myb-like domain-containing protein n=1 Tax=Prunus yedoensis var. nudiflora TaxID=2094558 RepID=A0A314YAY5_PRUYE|nr:uncharacterized protein Pyn_31485 [Prunus yedoensis var. nudiflora]